MADNGLIVNGNGIGHDGEHPRFAQNRVNPRLTITENVYHQLPGEQPTQTSASFCQSLESEEDPQLRRYKATEEWAEIPFDKSFNSLACVKIENREGTRLAVQPDVDELADIASRVLEIGFAHPGSNTPTHENRIIVLPGTSVRFALASTAGVLIRCRHGDARYFLAAIPG